MRFSLADGTTTVLALCAVVITGLAVRREMSPAEKPDAATPRRVANWRDIANRGARRPRRATPVTIVEFADFECPYCALLQPALRQVLAKYPTTVALVYRHFPLEAIHPNARAAATAAECAREQGRFGAYADSLFARQKQLGALSWVGLAREVGIADSAAFERCRAAPAAAARVSRDLAVARKLGLPGTPALLINDQLYIGVQTLATLDSAVVQALRASGTRQRLN